MKQLISRGKLWCNGEKVAELELFLSIKKTILQPLKFNMRFSLVCFKKFLHFNNEFIVFNPAPCANIVPTYLNGL